MPKNLILAGVVTIGFLVVPLRAIAQNTSADELKFLNSKLKKQQDVLNAQLNQLQRQMNVIASERAELARLAAGYNVSIHHSAAPSSAAKPTISTTPTNTKALTITTVATTQRQQSKVDLNKKTQLMLQTSSALSSSGGVLTPKGKLIIDPSINYSYYDTSQVNVNGFTIIPGITFGNININKNFEHLYTGQLTFRYGLTNKSDIYVRVPFDAGYDTTVTSPVLVGQTVAPLVVSSHAFNLGDIQFGGSYQINHGTGDIPTFVTNLNFKTITGISPFAVPIFTATSPNGTFLEGIDTKLATGTGFYQLQPSLTMLYPSSPVILFANVKYVYNFARTVGIQSLSGGAPTRARLRPGNGIGIAFGMGFSLNNKTSFSIGYEQDQYFNQTENGTGIKGTSFDEGAFDFGLGYRISKRVNVDVGVGIGVGPNSPAAQIVVRLPVSFNLS